MFEGNEFLRSDVKDFIYFALSEVYRMDPFENVRNMCDAW